MKISIVFAAFIAVNAAAAPKASTPEAHGLYVGNSSQYNYFPRSAKPPQTTYALIEPNGEIWSTSATILGAAFPIIGKIRKKTGDGAVFAYSPTPIPLELKTTITPSSIKLDVIEAVRSTLYHIPSPPPILGQRGPYDVDLLLQPENIFSAPPQMTDVTAQFTMNIVGDKFNGAQGNCNFQGTLQNADGYKRVNLTFENDCYLNTWAYAKPTIQVQKKTRMEGVIFTTKHFYNRPEPDAEALPVNMLILKSKTGEDFGIAKFFLMF